MPRLNVLQWGRTREGAEGFEGVKIAMLPYPLQWGRTREGAEGRGLVIRLKAEAG